MKKLFLILLAFALASPVMAQKNRPDKNNRAEAVAIGIKVGGNLAQYQYYPDLYEFNTQPFGNLMSRLNPMFGLNVEIPVLRGVIYVNPEVLFDVRGDSRLYDNDTKQFQVKVNYLEARVPVAVAVPISEGFKPYVFVAPSFSWALPTIGPFESDTSNMAHIDYGLILGAGLRFKFNLPGFSMLLKLEGGYYSGLYDTFKGIDHSEQVPSLDPKAFNIDYSRQNRGFEAALTIAIPLDFHSPDDCFYWAEVEKQKNKKRGMFGF